MKDLIQKIKRKVKSGFTLKTKKKKSLLGLSYSRRKSSGKKKGRGKFKNAIILTILIGCVLLLLVGFLINVYKLGSVKFEKAYKDDSIVEDGEEWTGEGRINILLIGMDKREGEFGFVDALAVVMVDSSDSSIGVFSINPDIVITVPQEPTHQSRLRNLYNWGILENKGIPIEILTSGVESLLSIKIDRYLIINEEGLVELVNVLGGVYVKNSSSFSDSDIQSSVGGNFDLEEGSYRLSGSDLLSFLQADDDSIDNKLHRQVIGIEGFLKRATSYIAFLKLSTFLDISSKQIYTDLSKSELIWVVYKIMRFKEVKTSYSRLNSLRSVETERAIEYYPTLDQLDQDIQKVFIDKRVGKEQARVEVFNSTSVKGLASSKARWLRNIGVDVIRVGDSAASLEKTTIYTREEGKYTYTIDAIKRSFDEDVEVMEGELPNLVSTGDVIVVLGENGSK
ncbi:LCP family protein [Patescibacteria group bacterium]